MNVYASEFYESFYGRVVIRCNVDCAAHARFKRNA